MVVMMVVVRMVTGVFDVTLLLMTMLTLCFYFKCCVADSVFTQLFSDSVLDVVSVFVCNYMHGGVIVVTIHAPDVNVVYADYAVNVEKMLLDLINFDLGGGLFKKEIKYLLKTFESVYENKYRNTYRHDGIYQ